MASVSTLPSTSVRYLRKLGIDPYFCYPLVRSRALKAGRTRQVLFAERKIVLVRPEKGDVFALEDRCAHRQVTLSLGVVRADKLL